MIHLPIVCFEPEARPDMREPGRILARMADDAVGLRNSVGYIDFADLRALGWTRAQLEEHGRAASNDAVRRMAFAGDPFRALSDDDYGRVCVMAATLPVDIDLGDELAVMLHLSRARFAAIDIARLVTDAVAKARELREAASRRTEVLPEDSWSRPSICRGSF